MVFSTQIKILVMRSPPPPTALFIDRLTETAITVRWENVLDVTSLCITKNIIRLSVINTYTYHLPPLPNKWTVDIDTEPYLNVTSLHPGTQYEIIVSSYSEEYGEGKAISTMFETLIDTPYPEPSLPQIISRKGSKLEIEIPLLINYNGPISFIQIVVILADSVTGLLYNTWIDENRLTNYEIALTEGINYYISAQLNFEVATSIRGNKKANISESHVLISKFQPNQNHPRRFVIGDGRSYNGYKNAPLPIDRPVYVTLGIDSWSGGILKSRYADISLKESSVHL